MTTQRETARDEALSAAEATPIDRFVERLLARAGAQAGVGAVFGEAVRHGDVTVVPVARTRWGVGGGFGVGPADEHGRPLGSGSGGGGGAMAGPVGYLEIRDTGATFHPIRSGEARPALVLAAGVAAWLVLRALARLRSR